MLNIDHPCSNEVIIRPSNRDDKIADKMSAKASDDVVWIGSLCQILTLNPKFTQDSTMAKQEKEECTQRERSRHTHEHHRRSGEGLLNSRMISLTDLWSSSPG